jgi:hypothetical protein
MSICQGEPPDEDAAFAAAQQDIANAQGTAFDITNPAQAKPSPRTDFSTNIVLPATRDDAVCPGTCGIRIGQFPHGHWVDPHVAALDVALAETVGLTGITVRRSRNGDQHGRLQRRKNAKRAARSSSGVKPLQG